MLPAHRAPSSQFLERSRPDIPECRASRAAFSLHKKTAAAPSEIGAQSRSLSGDATIRELKTSSSVRGDEIAVCPVNAQASRGLLKSNAVVKWLLPSPT